MADNPPAQEFPSWPMVEAWLSASEEGRLVLAGWRNDPQAYAPVVAAWVRQHAATAPKGVATYVSGGQIEQLVNIATAGELNLSGPVTVNVFSSAPLRQLGTETAAALDATGSLSRASFEPETVYVPGGSSVIGSDGGDGVYEYETPRSVMTLPAYRIARYPITNAQYLEFARRTRAAVPSEVGWLLASVGQEPPPGKGEHPVVGLSWDEAVGYCRWLSEVTKRPYRLPSEAEWEAAARGTDGRRYPWGNAFDIAYCNSIEAGVGATTAVGAHAPQGDSVYGCSDMAGNVWEWTSTIWGVDRVHAQFGPPYRTDDGRDSLQPSVPYRELRICRGGSFRERCDRVACTARNRQPAGSRDSGRGFRVVMEV
jgi:formylglycine-generating enzyme required for sulfatase activity